MATTNRERVNKGMDLLHAGLMPIVRREMLAVYKTVWFSEAEYALGTNIPVRDGEPHLDITMLLRLIDRRWNEVFRKTMSRTERSIANELIDVRNRWAHNEQFNGDDTERTLDNVYRLLTAVAATQAEEVRKEYEELRRLRVDEQTRGQRRRAVTRSLEGMPTAGLTPWREIATPHPDVAGGRYQQAEFAADLGQVHRGEGVSEYRDPREFFQRTYLTEGLQELLVNAVKRLSREGGDPVVKLQTNFGGGKTHAMLALYHLVSDSHDGNLPGVEPVLQAAGVKKAPLANRAVWVGTAPGAAEPRVKPDGTVINTMWGDLAWQLLGKDGFEIVASADRTGTSPGSDRLRELFRQAEPALILIDEWVASVRGLYSRHDLPAGSFDANLTFAQEITEAARAVPGTLIVATLPQSDIEIGGDAGKEALTRLENTFGRIESVWRPASTEESFEIVRRRLFEPITDPQAYVKRDATIRAFRELYQQNQQSFPSGVRETEYERRMQAAYPIHPELFDRLYEDWSTLERFQRTRGVLRLMAVVIHALWERNDTSLLIMPSSIPMDDGPVVSELTRYLDDQWRPIIEKDIDGPNSLPVEIERDHTDFARALIARRVARSIYMGSAPLTGVSNRGVDDQHLNLACVQPSEKPAIFGDALRRLNNRATYLNSDGSRYWYSTQPTVNRMAMDRAAQQTDDAIYQEIVRRLRDQSRDRGDFSRVHAVPASGADVADEREARLVILGPDHPHTAREESSPARQIAATILDSRGTTPRRYRNTLAFVAPDRTRLGELSDAVRQYLSWSSILAEREQLNLDPFATSQASARMKDADQTVDSRMPGTFTWLLVPGQETNGPVYWDEARLPGDDTIARRASRRMKTDMTLLTETGATIIRKKLDDVPLWRGNHVSIHDLTEWYAQYLYLERLRDSTVLTSAIQQGVASLTWMHDSFAYAEGWDEDRQRYRGLVAGRITGILDTGQSVLVKPDVALAQIQADRADADRIAGQSASPGTAVPYDPGAPVSRAGIQDPPVDVVDKPPVLSRFYATVDIADPVRLGSEAGRIADEVLGHLSAVPGSRVRVTLEIEADVPGGANEHTIRTVTENARTLGFRSAEFEEG